MTTSSLRSTRSSSRGQVVLASTNVKSCQELVEIPALGDYVVDHRILDNRSADAIIGSSECAWCQGESERR